MQLLNSIVLVRKPPQTTRETVGVGCALVELYLLKRAGLGLSVTVADPYFTSGVGTLAFRLNFPGYNVAIKG